MFGLLYGLYAWAVEKREYHVLIIGLENAGKSTLLERLNFEFNKRGLPPEKIRPTVGLNIGRIETKGIRINFFDLGGQQGLRSIWEKYYSDSNAVLFVVDSADSERLQEAKQTFESVMEEQKLESLPLLLVVNKQDINDALSAESIAELFEIQTRSSRRIRVQPVSAITGAGLVEGVQWLAENL